MPAHFANFIAFDERTTRQHSRRAGALGLKCRGARFLAGRANRLLADASLYRAKVRIIVFTQGRADVVDGAGDVGEAGEVGGMDPRLALAAGEGTQRLDELVKARHRRM